MAALWEISKCPLIYDPFIIKVENLSSGSHGFGGHACKRKRGHLSTVEMSARGLVAKMKLPIKPVTNTNSLPI